MLVDDSLVVEDPTRSVFQVGDLIESLRGGGGSTGGYHPGVITDVNADGSYSIKFDESGDIDPSAEKRSIRVPKKKWRARTMPRESPTSDQCAVRIALLKEGTTSVRYDDVAGNYFHVVDDVEADATCVDVSLSLHPDNALRKVGIITQRGLHHNAPVEFCPRIQQWVRLRDNVMLPNVKGTEVKFLSDVIPGGVINVIGDFSINDMSHDDEKKGSGHTEVEDIDRLAKQLDAMTCILKKRKTKFVDASKSLKDRMRIIKSASGKAQEEDGYAAIIGAETPLDEVSIANDITGIVDMADADSKFLKEAEVAKFLRQYFTRGIPAAAKSVSACVVYHGHNDVSELLAKGMTAITDKAGMERVADRTRIFGIPTYLGVNSKDRADTVLKRGYTHHVFLSMTGGHNFRDSAPMCSECKLVVEPVDMCNMCPTSKEYQRLEKMVEGQKVNIAKLPIASPVHEDVARYKQDLLETLTSGYNRIPGKANEPPNRRTLPIVTIVVGGDVRVRHEILQSVKKNWPILIIEGSGGYADVLTSVINKVNEIAPDSGIDEFRSFLTGIDPVTSEIINRSNYIIVKKGTKNEQFVRYILNAMRGDEILLKAWKMHAIWDHNSGIWQFNNELYQIAVLLVSICATGAAVIQTFMLLVWKNSNLPYPDEWKAPAVIREDTQFLFLFYTILQWSVIGLPIGLTLIHALINRANAWAKWTALRCAAENSLQEIYMYRTRTLGYSFSEVKRKKMLQEELSGGSPPPAKTTELYSSREDLLGIRIIAIQDELAASDVNAVTLKDPCESLPPPTIRQSGDTGFHDLTPDEYVRFRLGTARALYQAKSIEAGRMLSLITYIIYLMGAWGTTLAALSAYGLMYLQAWVAFTTALVSSFQRFLDYSRVSNLHALYNQTVSRLTDVEGWWSALGPAADDMKNRNHLVEDVESIIRNELEGWTKQLQRGAEEMKKAQAAEQRGRDDITAVRQGKELKQVKDMRELGLDALSPDNLKTALLDPNGPMASKLKKQLVVLNESCNDKLAVVATITADVEKKITEKLTDSVKAATEGWSNLEETFLNAASKKDYQRTAEIIRSTLTDETRKFIVDVYMRDKFLEYVRSGKINAKCLNIHLVMEVAARVNPSGGGHIRKITPREVMEFVKSMCMQDMCLAITKDSSSSTLFTAIKPESFIGEFKRIVTRPDYESLEHSSLVQLLKDPDIKRTMMKIPPQSLVNLLKAASEILNPMTNPVSTLAETALVAISNADCDVMEADTEARVAFWGGMMRLQSLRVAVESLTREEILEFFSPKFQYVFQDRSQLQLSQYLLRLSAGTLASRTFERLCFEKKELMTTLCANLRVFSHVEWRERFIIAAQSLNQIDINRWSKGDLVKAMRVQPSFLAELADCLLESFDENDLWDVLSGIQSLFSNTFAGRIIDRLADELSTFDLRGMLSVEDRDKLCARIIDLREFDTQAMSKDQIMNILGSVSLTKSLDVLSEKQVKELVCTLGWIMCTPFSLRICRTARDALGSRFNTPVGLDILKACTQEVIDKFLSLVTHLTRHDIVRLRMCTTITDLVNALGDAVITRAFINVVRDMTKHASYCNAVLTVVEYLFSMSGDGVLEEVIRRVALCTADRSVVTKLGTALYGSEAQCTLRASLSAVAGRLMQTPFVRLQRSMASLSELASVIQNNELLSGMAKQGLTKDRDLRDFFIGFTSHFVVSVPYYFFLRVCDHIRTFDLRDIFLDVSGRYRFVLMVAALIVPLKAKMKPDNEDNNPFDGARLAVTKGEVLKILDSADVYFDTVRAQLRLMKLESIQKVLVVAVSLLENSDTGRVYLHYLNSKKFDLKDMSIHECVHLIRSQYEVHGEELKEMFCNFDVSKFCSTKQTERIAILSKFIDDEDLLTFLSKFEQGEIEVVFAHLTIACSNGATLNVQRRYREAVELKESDAQLGPEWGLGTGEPEYDDD